VALGSALCWAASAVLYKEALLKAKPFSANVVRLASTSAALVFFLVVVGKFWVLTSLSLRAVVLTLLSGVIGLGVGDTLYMISLKLIGVARAVPITCTYPLFSLLWATFLRGENVTLQIVLGTLAIVFGIWLISREENNRAETSRKTLVKGIVIAIATAAIWSVSISLINMAVGEKPDMDQALAVNVIRVVMVALLMLSSTPIIDRDFSFVKMERKSLLSAFAGGVVALGLGWFFLAYSFAVGTPESRAVPISSTTPLFSTLSALVFLKERVTAKNIAGSVLIVLGIFLIFTA